MSNAISDLKGNDNEITISAGNTGAMMAYATVYLRTMKIYLDQRLPHCFHQKSSVCF